MGAISNDVIVRQLGLRDYETTWREMQSFTRARDADSPDELWVVQHPPVFTLGTNGKAEHILNAGDIPVVKIDRGGQVTYHGPGQLVIYLLLNLHRRKLGIRKLVTILEESIVALLKTYGVDAYADPDAPGVYVNKRKIAALGLRVSRGYTTHGLSLNVNMDLEPFTRINPCGYAGLEIIQCQDLGIDSSIETLANELISHLNQQLQTQMTTLPPA